MSIISFNTLTPGLVGVNPRIVQMISTDNRATITAAGYLNRQGQVLEGFDLYPTDEIHIIYNYVASTNTGTFGVFLPNFSNGLISLNLNQSDAVWFDITATAAALATAGKVVVQPSFGVQQYKVRDIRVNYAAAGLSGGGGNRLLVLTDGTTVYNNAGITAAVLGTPVNTLWGGTGNPVAGTVAQNTLTAPGANLYLQYSGGTTDYSTGSVVISVLVQRSV